MRLLVATILCGMATAACGASAAPATAPLPPTHDFALVYERSGGLAASTESLRVAPGGSAVAATSGTRAGERRVRFQLGERRIRALQRGLRRADLGSISERQGGCADCYIYSITYEGISLELEETEVPPRLRAVFGQIETIVSTHTIPPNARLGG
jgi:hypothetical protein